MRIKNRLLGLIFTIAITGQVFAQTGVIISAEANQIPHESAMLEIKSNGKGLLIPRMTMLERANIQPIAEGLLVYQTNDVKGFYYYTGTEWTAFVSTSDITNWDIDASNDITTSQVTNIGSGQIITQTERDNWNAMNSVPVGTVIPFAGDVSKIPEGWLLCDGAGFEINPSNEYWNLYQTIGINWGGVGTQFNIPNLQGQFLRGTDNGTGNDPDAAIRTKIDGTTIVGDLVGSYQGDALQNITGTISGTRGLADWNSNQSGALKYESTSSSLYRLVNGQSGQTGAAKISFDASLEARTSSETRPKNASVNYIIKY